MTEEQYNIKHTVDTCGYCCPIPMISTLKVLARIEMGEQIEVKSTDSAFDEDIKTIARSGKCKIIFREEREDYNYYVIEK